MNTTMEKSTLHPFERAGLGKAPFRCIAVERRIGPIKLGETNGVEHWVGSPGQPMGTCDYCSQGIADCYTVVSADGKRFEVGCECVRRCNDDVHDFDQQKRRLARMKRKATKAREAERIDEMQVRLQHDTDLQDMLAAEPNPRREGESLLGWALWMMENAGHAGKLRVVSAVEKIERRTT